MRSKHLQFRLATLLIGMSILSIAIAIFLSPNRYPPEVREILATLPDIPSNAKLETVVRMLVKPPRPADGSDYLRPDNNPRLYVNLEGNYRLALDFQCNVTKTDDGKTIYGVHTFDGAHVEEYDDDDSSWNPVYPVRTKTKMKSDENGG